MRILYQGPLWEGSTSLQRARALGRQPGVELEMLDTGARVGSRSTLWHRVRWKLRWPVDVTDENGRLLETAGRVRPDVVVVDNSKVIAASTLQALRRGPSARLLAYYTPDDVMGRHNLSHPLRRSFPHWDLFLTTKSFNVAELARAGVRHPVLVGKAYDPQVHRPLSAAEVGAEYEAFDLVFIGSYEAERCTSINALGRSGLKVVVYGAGKGGWTRSHLHETIALRPSVFADEYTRAMHHGRIALCFLRKLNRDRITQRTMEIAAMARPMLAEKTEEHDAHFHDGREYLGFRTDEELVAHARAALADPDLARLGHAARERSERSGYSTDARAAQLVSLAREHLRA